MAVVYYKYKSSKYFHSIPIEGPFLSVSDFKAQIFSSQLYGKGKDFDLLISDAKTDQQYADGPTLIPAYSYLLIRRVPGIPPLPIVIGEEKPKIEGKPSSVVKDPQEVGGGVDFHDFGLDFNSIPSKSEANSSNTHCKEDKSDSGFKVLPVKGFGIGKGRSPPEGYVCHRCKVAGHYIQHCPTNGDPSFDFKRVKPTTWISKASASTSTITSEISMSSASTSSSSGISKASASTSTGSAVENIPPELYCPLCKRVMKDAALAKCCFASFCDKCIKDRMVSKSVCVCRRKIVADDILPNMTLRVTINRILNLNQCGDTASDNSGSVAANMKTKPLLAEKEIQQKKLDSGDAEEKNTRKRKAEMYLR
ncbi:hypothetical protein DITRI_Ditri02bG0164800 [Diplodiscus trichospermus]